MLCGRHTSLLKLLKGGDIQGSPPLYRSCPRAAIDSWGPLPLILTFFSILFLYLPNPPKPSQNPSQNHPKIDIFAEIFLSFFRSYFASIFGWFFVDFKCFETLKIVLPPARELNFYKIAVFALSPKIHQKTIEIRFPKSKKNRKKMWKKRVWKHAGF